MCVLFYEKNQREPNLLVIHITNEAGTFSKSTSINKCCAKRFKAQCLELISGFNKASNKDDWYILMLNSALNMWPRTLINA